MENCGSFKSFGFIYIYRWLSNARILWDGLIMFKYHNEELKYIYEYDYGLMVDWKKFESGYKL